jgi:hypothetical protein
MLKEYFRWINDLLYGVMEHWITGVMLRCDK